MRSVAPCLGLLLTLVACGEQTRALAPIDEHFILVRLHPDPSTRVGELLGMGTADTSLILQQLGAIGCENDPLVLIHVERERGQALGRASLLIATAADASDLCVEGGPVVIQDVSYDEMGEPLVSGPLLIEGQTLDGRLPIGSLDPAGGLSVFPVWWQVSGRAFGIERIDGAGLESVRVEDAEAHAVWQVRQMHGERIGDLEGGDPTDPRTMLDVALASGIQPDVDTDGDGRERFELDRVTGLLARCRDGDGTLVEGSDCAADPRFADGYDITLLFRLEHATPVTP